MKVAEPRTTSVWNKTFLVSIALLLFASACGGGGEKTEGGEKKRSLTVYSGRGEDLVGPLLKKFEEGSGVSVEVRYGESADLALLLGEEGDRSKADVFFAQSPGAVGFLSGKDLLADLDEDLLAEVPGGFRSKSGKWVGVSGRQRVIVHNPSLIKAEDLPASVFDLTDPKFKGKVAVAPNNASFQDFLTAMTKLKGETTTADWLKGMAANESPVFAKNDAIVAAVAKGEVAMGLVNHYYNVRHLAENPSAPSRNYYFPGQDLGSIVLPATASILKSSEQKDVAVEFIAFLLSKQGQEYFRDETSEYPLAAGVTAEAGLPALDPSKSVPYDFDDLGEGLEKTAKLIAESGISN
ncbi:MAG: extracellular solute-binding protein [Actinomycetota bacterium]